MIVELTEHFGAVFESALIEEIVQVATLRTIPAGSELIDIGETVKGLPLMLEGAIKISNEDQNGDELLLYYLEAGDSCTMTLAWELGEQKSKIRAVTEMPSQLIMIPLPYVEQWTHTYASWRQFIFKSYQKRMEELLETLDSIAFDQLEERLWNYLCEKRRITQSPFLHITHQTIAQEIHSSRVVISRLLKRLEKTNKIHLQRNGIEILVAV